MRGEETDGAVVDRKMLSEAGFQIWCLFLSICSRTAGGGGFFSDLIPLWKWWKPHLVVPVRSTEGMHGESRLAGEGRLPLRTSRLRRGSQGLLWVALPIAFMWLPLEWLQLAGRARDSGEKASEKATADARGRLKRR